MNQPATLGGALRQQLCARVDDAVARITHCLRQLDDEQVWWRQREEMNSIGNLVLHLCGNLQQWIVAGVAAAADDRDRPGEFSQRSAIPRQELADRLQAMAQRVTLTIHNVSDAEFLQPRRIQGFAETVLSAVLNSVTHLCGHAQEIVSMTRQQLGPDYRFAWTPETPEQGAPS